ncbi:hypothetical protein [Alkalimonas amylolytica]|uniref:Uncharacterized protein n=1 Tax=Alkalimonas amylolytica TaxID=152573 RepID=A0A1H4FV81_ALKAM|nr:hypothetical protein [Alkalimonas amylolytica]SEB00412.1 hypothetical protein SAMN04488051_11310 [Alkalimonas amylolytica]
MSVINQMLKDLDQRKAGVGSAQSLPPPVVAVRHRLPLRLLIGLAGIVIALALWWFGPGISSKPMTPGLLSQAELPADALQQLPTEGLGKPQLNETDSKQQFVTEQRSELPYATELPELTSDPTQTINPELEIVVAEQAPQSEPSKPVQAAMTSGESGEASEPALPQLRVERVALSPVEQQQRLSQQARQAEQAGRASEARAYWQQLQAMAPQQSEAYVALARMAQQGGHEAGSQYWLQLGLEQGADVHQLVPLLAASYARQQLWQPVLQVLELLPETGLRPAELAMRAAAWQQLGQYQAALTAFEQLGQLEPHQGRWWLGMAISSDALGQRQQAALQFQRSLQFGEDLTPASKDYIRQRLQELN